MIKDKEQMLFSRKQIAAIIFPLLLQNLLSIAIGMADSIMVSNKGEAAFAGVSLVNSLDTVLITLFSALTAGGSVVLAQAIGRKDRDYACKAAKQMLYVSTAVAAAISAVVLLLRVPILKLLFGEVEADVLRNALDYFFFIAISFPFLAIENSVAATLRAQGDSMTSLKVSILMNLLNIAGNAVLIYGLDLGAAGAAIATLFSRMTGAFIKLIVIRNKKRYIYVEKLFHYRPDGAMIKPILRFGIPNGIEQSMYNFGNLITASLVSSLGTVAIAANAAANSICNIQYSAGGASQSAMVPVVGRCVGAKEKEQAKYYTWLLVGIAYLIVIAIAVPSSVFATPLLRFYGLSGETSQVARWLLIYQSAVTLLLWPIAFCLPSALRAAGDVKYTMKISIFSMWVFRVALAYVMAQETVSLFGILSFPGLGMGIMGVRVAVSVDWLFRAILFLWRVISGRWLTKYRGVKLENK
ncbi:MAG: MATE family efflux transporter [Clostridia bacterium]|nr:MATE family efflux transporter [Clostridia bacterium]